MAIYAIVYQGPHTSMDKPQVRERDECTYPCHITDGLSNTTCCGIRVDSLKEKMSLTRTEMAKSYPAFREGSVDLSQLCPKCVYRLRKRHGD